MAKFSPDKVYTYGYGRYEVLSGFVNGLFLIFVAFSVLIESLERLLEPPEINTDNILLVSVLGLLVNRVGLYAFHGDMGGENVKGVFLHVLADTLGSVGVIISTILV
jgi:zinc transporter 5/7